MAAATPGGISPTHPVWKRGVPRDAGVGWDFEDVRDHYLKLLYNVDPMGVRYASTERYFELSRLVTGEVMAEVFGEWRRTDSQCKGGIVLWCNDLTPGAGWGLFDSAGRPKAAYWFLRRAFAPVAVWMTDEGLNGIGVHVANDRAAGLDLKLRVALYQHGERLVASGEHQIAGSSRAQPIVNLETLLGRFSDASYAYRFGSPGHDVVVASVYDSGQDTPFSQAFRFPAGRSSTQIPIDNLGLSAVCQAQPDGTLMLRLQAKRFAWGVRITARGALPGDQYFGLEPGVPRVVVLTPAPNTKTPSTIHVSAANAEGRMAIPVEQRT